MKPGTKNSYNSLSEISINNKNYKFFKLDLIKKNKLSKIIKKYKPNCIFNLAAETHVDRSIDNPESFIQSNIVGVFNLLECFKDYSKKYKSNRYKYKKHNSCLGRKN